MKLAKIGGYALKLYALHLLWFTIGVIAGSIQTFGILAVMWGPK